MVDITTEISMPPINSNGHFFQHVWWNFASQRVNDVGKKQTNLHEKFNKQKAQWKNLNNKFGKQKKVYMILMKNFF